MTGTDRTVQVRVSLIEQLSDAYDDDDGTDRFAALLEQLWALTVPTSAADTCTCDWHMSMRDPNPTCPAHAAPLVSRDGV